VRARYRGRVQLQAGGAIDQAAVDEALLSLAPVLDVRAGLRRKGSKDVLEVEVLAVGAGAGLRAQVIAALRAVPALKDAVASGRLLIDVVVGSVPWSHGVGTAKRMLLESMH
jgi:hypothetical protein